MDVYVPEACCNRETERATPMQCRSPMRSEAARAANDGVTAKEQWSVSAVREGIKLDKFARELMEKCATGYVPVKKPSAKYDLIVLDNIATRGEQNYSASSWFQVTAEPWPGTYELDERKTASRPEVPGRRPQRRE
jgi:hypothetical protein